MLNKNISLDCGNFYIGDYTIVGNYDDGYEVWLTENDEDNEAVYEDISFENCVVWCLNS